MLGWMVAPIVIKSSNYSLFLYHLNKKKKKKKEEEEKNNENILSISICTFFVTSG